MCGFCCELLTQRVHILGLGGPAVVERRICVPILPHQHSCRTLFVDAGNCAFHQVFLDTPLDECLRRNGLRGLSSASRSGLRPAHSQEWQAPSSAPKLGPLASQQGEAKGHELAGEGDDQSALQCRGRVGSASGLEGGGVEAEEVRAHNEKRQEEGSRCEGGRLPERETRIDWGAFLKKRHTRGAVSGDVRTCGTEGDSVVSDVSLRAPVVVPPGILLRHHAIFRPRVNEPAKGQKHTQAVPGRGEEVGQNRREPEKDVGEDERLGNGERQKGENRINTEDDERGGHWGKQQRRRLRGNCGGSSVEPACRSRGVDRRSFSQSREAVSHSAATSADARANRRGRGDSIFPVASHSSPHIPFCHCDGDQQFSSRCSSPSAVCGRRGFATRCFRRPCSPLSATSSSDRRSRRPEPRPTMAGDLPMPHGAALPGSSPVCFSSPGGRSKGGSADVYRDDAKSEHAFASQTCAESDRRGQLLVERPVGRAAPAPVTMFPSSQSRSSRGGPMQGGGNAFAGSLRKKKWEARWPACHSWTLHVEQAENGTVFPTVRDCVSLGCGRGLLGTTRAS